MNTYKHKIRISKSNSETMNRDELQSRVIYSLVGAEPGTEVELEITLQELYSLPYILEPLEQYSWTLIHTNPKSLEIGRKLFPGSETQLGGQNGTTSRP